VIAEESLSALGFTDLEALLYCELLRQSPASGYRLAKAVGKAPANTYHADEGTPRAFLPVPPAELLAVLQNRFEQRRAEAASQLARIAKPTEADRIYQIRDAGQLYERAQTMLAEAGDIILFDLFPEPFSRMRPALDAAVRRGVTVAGLVYEPLPEPAAFTTLMAAGAPQLTARWPGAQMTLITDGQEHLVALLSGGGGTVLHGAWSDSAYLSCLHHNGLASEIRLLGACPDEDDPLAGLGLLRSYPAGLRTLLSEKGNVPLEEIS
jgi:hypothetical protein